MPDTGSTTPLRVGIAGYGLAGEVFHAPLVDAVGGLEVAAIVTTDEARIAKARAAFPDARVVPSVDDLWEHVDVLVIATPNRFHAELALAAIARDLPVVVDKPFASTADEAERIVAAGGRVTVFQSRRWDGDFLTVRRLVDEGAFGTVLRMESRFERFRPEVGGGWRERGDAAEGGGQLLDLGAHLVDQAVVLFGVPTHVYGEVGRRRPGAEADDDVFVALEHPDGVRSHHWMSAIAPLYGPRLALGGMAGGFAVDGLDPQEDQLKAGLRPGAPGFGERPAGRFVTAAGAREQPIDAGRYVDYYAAVRDWVRGGGPPPVDPRDSLTVLRILEAARHSAHAHEVVRFA